MKLGQQLKLKQNQSLIMTPQLQQAIKLLQLSNIGLTEFIENAQLENPFLKEKIGLSEKKLEPAENTTPDICNNLNNSTDPLKKDSNVDLENTFDTHLSSDFNRENKNLSDKEIIKSSNTTSAGEVIEKTLEVLLVELRCLKNIDSVDRRNQARTKSLIALNILQTSLDFKPDENLAENLFRLYEFIKNSVLNYREKIDDLIASIQIVSELYESWCSINSKD